MKDRLRSNLPSAWRGAASDRCHTPRMPARKIMARPKVALAGGSRERFDAWMPSKGVRSIESIEAVQFVGASGNVRRSRPQTECCLLTNAMAKDVVQLRTVQRGSPPGAGRAQPSIRHKTPRMILGEAIARNGSKPGRDVGFAKSGSSPTNYRLSPEFFCSSPSFRISMMRSWMAA
jgi:hypothetical protein